jgi:hypothetical protein
MHALCPELEVHVDDLPLAPHLIRSEGYHARLHSPTIQPSRIARYIKQPMPIAMAVSRSLITAWFISFDVIR